MKKTYSVRLDEEDAALWDSLMAWWRMDRSDTLRRLLREWKETGSSPVNVAPRPIGNPKESVRLPMPIRKRFESNEEYDGRLAEWKAQYLK